jgi:ubiquinone/menaquinone biosynthesis C-methylase UbiE
MDTMTEHRPHSVIHAWHNHHDYLPAMGRDALLPIYDVFTRLLGINKIHDALIAQAELESGIRVLEIGCGPGNLTIRAKRAQPGAELIGSDPDPRALARAQRKARGLAGIRFERAYAQELPYADGEFDRVLSSLMLHHLDDDVRTSAAAEIFRVLRPGGRLHLVDIGGEMTAHHGLAARWMKRNPHVVGNLGDAIPRLLQTAGFDCAEVGARRHRLIGQLTFYRATRPA